MSFEFPLDHRPTHRLLNLFVVIRDLNPRDGVLKILVLIGTGGPVNDSTSGTESANSPANFVENESKAVFVRIQATRKGVMNDARLLRLLHFPLSRDISDGPQLHKILTESFQVLEDWRLNSSGVPNR